MANTERGNSIPRAGVLNGGGRDWNPALHPDAACAHSRRAVVAPSTFEHDVASKPPPMTRLRRARTGIPFRLALVALAAAAFGVHSASVRTFDGKLLEGELRFNDVGALVLKSGEAEPVTIELKEVARA